jgi:hypothetical protein
MNIYTIYLYYLSLLYHPIRSDPILSYPILSYPSIYLYRYLSLYLYPYLFSRDGSIEARPSAMTCGTDDATVYVGDQLRDDELCAGKTWGKRGENVGTTLI